MSQRIWTLAAAVLVVAALAATTGWALADARAALTDGRDALDRAEAALGDEVAARLVATTSLAAPPGWAHRRRGRRWRRSARRCRAARRGCRSAVVRYPQADG